MRVSHNSIAKLCPAQQTAFDGVMKALEIGNVVHLWGGHGRGKSTILKAVHQKTSGALLSIRDFFESSKGAHPLAVEESFYTLLFDTFEKHRTVLLDDVHLLDLSSGCHSYPRHGFINAAMMAVSSYVQQADKKLVLCTTSYLAYPASQRSYSFGVDRFKVDDYSVLVGIWHGAKVAKAIDFEKVFRFAPKLDAHQLKAACNWLIPNGRFTTGELIDYLKSQRLASNVDLGEVQSVDLVDLKGVSDVLRSLEINIVLPLENDALANEYQLRSKRGVLLYGPPGTGKTTVGRALAHRLKSKFFLIDGTFIVGTSDFYGRIHQVFEAAKDNAPAIIFIDDADSIFEDGEERGLYRYLLTMLDGLESESAGRICVMMTAMNVAHLPPALVRSGRVELWLEMKLPDEEARAQILAEHTGRLPEILRGVDTGALVAASDGFTGADLKRVVEDGKAIFAYDKARAVELKAPVEYFLQAVADVRLNKQRYAQAEAQASVRLKPNMPELMHYFVSRETVVEE